MGLSIATALLALGNSLALRASNRYRDKQHGRPNPEVSIDVSELADRHPDFRYIT